MLADGASVRKQAAFESLLEMLDESDRDVRQASIEALGRLRDRRASERLVKKLADPDRWVRRAAARALQELLWEPITHEEKALWQGVRDAGLV